ncbi:MAG: ribonuclease H-like domain-containing protein [Clostridiales Family XIII bacterium]|nr:ribonuclease H-like domain-containing protein [Clostridiales Family XIII bacterium]
MDLVYEEPFYASEIFDFYFGEARLGVFDIETTGLSASGAKLILGGLLIPWAGGVRVRQFFAEGAHEEAELLALYTDALAETDVLFSYNGDRFDIPFVNERLARRRRPPAFGDCLSFDMYRVIRNHSHLGDMLPNLKQKTVEDYLGLWRERKDRITGADSVRLYYEYTASRSPELLRRILLHNSDDLLQLARVLRVFGKLDLHKIASHVGFPVKCGESFAFVTEIKLDRRALEFSGKYGAFLPFDCVRFDEPWRISFQSETERFSVRVPCRCEAGVMFADLAELGADERDFAAYPAYGSGYLALRQGKEILYGPMNRLIKHVTQTAIARLSPSAR